jgi:hypothetical protein
MAGLGRKVFTRETLTSGDVNGYLMDQTVMVFASAAARSTAIPSPTDGMVTYLLDAKRADVHEDAAWQPAFYGTLQRAVGQYGGATDGNGLVTFNHGLGGAPTTVQVTPGNFVVQHLAKLVVSAVSSTQVQVVMYNTTNGTVIASNPIAFFWTAYR